MTGTDWLLTGPERRNDATRLPAWTSGCRAAPLVHGAVYFAELKQRIEAMRAGDLLLFTDWRGDPDQQMTDDPDSQVSQVLCHAASRGVDVRGLIWRSHWDKLAFSSEQNANLGTAIEDAGGEVLLDMRVRAGGSHHQKFVVLRHPGVPENDVAFVGGIDLCHSRRDDSDHGGDPQSQPMAKVYGESPPWHDAMCRLTGPVVADVEAVFRERWEDPQPLSRNPLHTVPDRLRGRDTHANKLPDPLPPPAATGPHTVQLLRTYGAKLGGYPFAPRGEQSVAHGYDKALRRVRRLVYVEDQYLWSPQITRTFADALRSAPDLHLIAVVPHHPDQDGKVSMPPNLIGRQLALELLHDAGPGRVAVYGVENHQGVPVYVHAKVCVMDDVWAAIGSDNVNRRSWTHDSELSAAVLDDTRDPREPRDPAGLGDGARTYARDLRLELAREHLDTDSDDGLIDPREAFERFRTSAAALEAWHRGGRQGERPPGRLRPLADPPVWGLTRLWSTALYKTLYDPDGSARASSSPAVAAPTL